MEVQANFLSWTFQNVLSMRKQAEFKLRKFPKCFWTLASSAVFSKGNFQKKLKVKNLGVHFFLKKIWKRKPAVFPKGLAVFLATFRTHWIKFWRPGISYLVYSSSSSHRQNLLIGRWSRWGLNNFLRYSASSGEACRLIR